VQFDVVNHPIIADRLTRLRDSSTGPAQFRVLLGQISSLLLYESMRQHRSTAVTVDTPMGPAPGSKLDTIPVLVPILRAGLGMLAAALEMLPSADTGFLGLRRDEGTLKATTYMNTLPPLDGDPVVLLDPMLATGGSALDACDHLEAAGAGEITIVCVLAAPEGIEAIRSSGRVARVVTASLEERLNDVGFILPGLGDAGDRQYGVD